MKTSLLEFFERDILKIKEEISLYTHESDMWETRGDISNTAGNLVLHLIGNLNHFIGATLGHSGYIRQRELEFSLKNVPRETLLQRLDETVAVVTQTITSLSQADFEQTYPLEKHGKTVSTTYMMLHLLTHLNYHLGQINYHRRMISAS